MNFRQRSTPAQRLRLGFVGGGLDSGIGSTHRYAATLDGQFEIVYTSPDLIKPDPFPKGYQ